MSIDIPPPVVIDGDAAVLLVAPHGALRDHDRLPWGSRALRMNDVHTASLTRELAARTGAAAVVNERIDRNVIDLNRLGSAVDRAPAFLAAIEAQLRALLARHPRATVLFVHGWNVGTPAVDLGFGVRPGRDDDAPSISPAFRTGTLETLVGACAAAGIRTAFGARYPARARENLLQLFTGRWADDERPLVRRLAALAGRVDALQVELGLPLRFPGPWRDRFVDACAAALTGAPCRHPPGGPATDHDASLLSGCAVQIAGAAVSGLVRLHGDGGLLVCVFPDGTMASFTGERMDAADPAGRVGGLSAHRIEGGLRIRHRGPCLRFPDTRPFEDLERGLVGARAAELDVAIDVVADADGFGHARGLVTLDGVHHALDDAAAFTAGRDVERGGVRAALRLDRGATLSLIAAPDATSPHGFLRRGDTRHAIVAATFDPPSLDAGRDRVAMRCTLADDGRVAVELEVLQRVPVVRNAPHAGARTVLAACRIAEHATPAGWIELPSPSAHSYDVR